MICNPEDDIKNLHIRMQILEALDGCKGYPLRQNILFNQLNISLEGIIDTSSFESHLEYLRSKGLIDYDTPPEGGPRRWQITEQGKRVYRDWQYNS